MEDLDDDDAETIRRMPSTLIHRFTLIKPGAKRISGNNGSSGSPSKAVRPSSPGRSGSSSSSDVGWSPFDFFFSSGLLVAKCDLCNKRLGWKPVLECDDCGLRLVVSFLEDDRMNADLLLRIEGHISSAASSLRGTVVSVPLARVCIRFCTPFHHCPESS